MGPEIDRMQLPNLYQTAFTRDHSALIGDRQMQISVVRAGTLYLPSGRIVFCDPLIDQKRESFVQNVLPGRYAVDLSLGLDEEANVERILFSRILFTKNEPGLWVKALCESEAGHVDEASFGLHTPSGTAAYMDQETAAKFQLESLADLDCFLDRLVGNYRPSRSWLVHAHDDEHSAIFFTSSRTDLPIQTYFAVDAGGDICLALSSLFL